MGNLICFTGYAGFFGGFVGGFLYNGNLVTTTSTQTLDKNYGNYCHVYYFNGNAYSMWKNSN